MAEPLLEVKNLHTYFKTRNGTVKAVNDVSYTIERGRTLGIVGESGSGKSVSAMSILRLLDANGYIAGGTVRFEGRDLATLSTQEMYHIRGNRISVFFQVPMTSLNPVFTIKRQLSEPFIIHQNMSKKEAAEKSVEMLRSVQIPNPEAVVKMYPHQLSGGMRQRVMIAMALACKPDILIADEPTTALDVTIQAQVLEIMQDLKETYKMGLIMITHDLGIVAEICDEVAVMYAGRIVEYGTLEDVFEHTLHPYTEGLFNSLPNINDRRHQLTPIPGLMPDPSKLPEGCAFAPRCRYATDACRAKQPQKRWVSSTHYVACSAYDDPAFHIERKEG